MNYLTKKESIFVIPNIKVFVLALVGLFAYFTVNAQEEQTASIKLVFDQTDSTRICKAVVVSDDKPVKEIDVHFYVQRSYSLLPIGSAVATDSSGEAIAEFPMDLPGDKAGNYVVVAKIEDDDTYGNVEGKSEVKWGIIPTEEGVQWNARSLSAARDKAPMILILVSNLIIVSIWGTIFYVIFMVFRIKKESKLIKTKTK